jgi:hypothetical protein
MFGSLISLNIVILLVKRIKCATPLELNFCLWKSNLEFFVWNYELIFGIFSKSNV